MTRRLILLTMAQGDDLSRLVDAFGPDVMVEVAYDLATLRAAAIDTETSLVSFGTGVIVPANILSRLSKPSYNIHAASPDFPGRDPHHHAVYHGATTYGATLHIMTERVDDGPIVGIESFPVAPGSTPGDLLAQANQAAFQLIERLGPELLDMKPLPTLNGVVWGSKKTKRTDLTQICSLTPLVAREDFLHRYRAFDGGAHDNLTVELHDQLFRIDKQTPAAPNDRGAFAEFTEDGFRALLSSLNAGGYRFARYGEPNLDRHVIWRHDVDFSMHRAARLAEIEANEGAVATYFVNPHCAYYNLLEPEIMRLTTRIRNLGHEIGLHFDAEAYDIKSWSATELDRALMRERSMLENILDSPVRCVSWHNPGPSNLLDFEADEIGGLANAYSAELKREYAYCSDSNGYWRFEPMSKVIVAGHHRLHLLSHPEWWTPEPLPPSNRIDRAILGRAQAGRLDYDVRLAQANRRNVT